MDQAAKLRNLASILEKSELFSGHLDGANKAAAEKPSSLQKFIHNFSLAAEVRTLSSDPALQSERRFAFKPGDPFDRVCIVVDGDLQICIPDGGPQAEVMRPGLQAAILGPGDVAAFTELASLLLPRTAATPPRSGGRPTYKHFAGPPPGLEATIIELEVETLAQTIADFPFIASNILRILDDRVRFLEGIYTDRVRSKQDLLRQTAALLYDRFGRAKDSYKGAAGLPLTAKTLPTSSTTQIIAANQGSVKRTIEKHIEALEACGAVTDDGDGRLIQLDRDLLALIAGKFEDVASSFEADDDDDAEANSEADADGSLSRFRRAEIWRREIEARLEERPLEALAVAQRALTDIGALKLDEKALRPEKSVVGRESGRKKGEQADHAAKRAGAKLSRTERKSMSDARMRGAVLTLHYRAVLALLRAGWTEKARDAFETTGLRQNAALLAQRLASIHAPDSRSDLDEMDLLAGALGDMEDVPGFVERLSALEARLLKEQAFEADTEAERVRLLVEAADVYRRVFTGPPRGSTFTGSNAAAMLMLAGRTGGSQAQPMIEQARGIAAEMLDQLRKKGITRWSFWDAANCAEAFWLRGNNSEAGKAARRASATKDCDVAKIQVVRRQWRRLEHAMPSCPQLFEALRPSPILVIAGSLKLSEWTDEALNAASALKPSDAFLVTPALPDGGRWNLQGAGRVVLFTANDAATALTTERSEEASLEDSDVRVAFRRALGLGALTARQLEAPLHFAVSPASLSTKSLVHDSHEALPAAELPEWAAADLRVGLTAILWVKVTTRNEEASGELPLKADIAATHRQVEPGLFVLAFERVSLAIDAALKMVDAGPRGDVRIRACIYMTPTLSSEETAKSLLRPQLAQLPDNTVYTTASAAAELALLRRPDLAIRNIGPARLFHKAKGEQLAQRRREQLWDRAQPIWAVRRVAVPERHSA